MSVHYLDNGATTPLCEEAVAAIHEAVPVFGNPSSLHGLGLRAELCFEADKQAVRKALGATGGTILFTSGGTEANNLCLFGAARAYARKGQRILVSAVEHASVLDTAEALSAEGFDIVKIYPDEDGNITPEAVLPLVDSNTILVSIMKMNNETGAVFPVENIAKAVKRKKADVLFHSDMVQSFCKVPVNLKNSGIDFVSVSGHKLHAPKGIGALYIAGGVRIKPLFFGGEQQKKLRPGTESTLLAHAFAAAVKAAAAAEEKSYRRVYDLCEVLKSELADVPAVKFNTAGDGCPYTVNLSALGVRSETMMHFLEEREVYVSSGSACSKGALSHVLKAMGIPAERIDSALRVSFSRFNTQEDVRALADGIKAGLTCLAKTKRRGE